MALVSEVSGKRQCNYYFNHKTFSLAFLLKLSWFIVVFVISIAIDIPSTIKLFVEFILAIPKMKGILFDLFSDVFPTTTKIITNCDAILIFLPFKISQLNCRSCLTNEHSIKSFSFLKHEHTHTLGFFYIYFSFFIVYLFDIYFAIDSRENRKN